ncbi:hypothetical protein WDW86_18660, partial [Bdellovibrionota bacterium FG-2]
MRYRNIIADSLVCPALISESSEKPNAGLLNAYPMFFLMFLISVRYEPTKRFREFVGLNLG